MGGQATKKLKEVKASGEPKLERSGGDRKLEWKKGNNWMGQGTPKLRDVEGHGTPKLGDIEGQGTTKLKDVEGQGTSKWKQDLKRKCLAFKDFGFVFRLAGQMMPGQMSSNFISS